MTNRTLNPVIYYIDGRLFEWYVTVGKLWLSIQLLFDSKLMMNGPFHWLSEVVDPKLIASLMLLTGIVRLGALIANGASLRVGPYLRSFAALFGSALWFWFGLSFYESAHVNNYGGPWMFWFLASAAEMYVVYRAVLDVRNHS